jgi:hypothetical protein
VAARSRARRGRREKTVVESTTLTAPDLRSRATDLRAGLFAEILAARETEDGFELAFLATSADRVRDFVFESQCCRFLT